MIAASDIAARLGLRAIPMRREWRGDCPSCGYASGLVVGEKEGRAVWWCASCQDREGITAAVRHALGRGGIPPQRVDRPMGPAPSTARKSAFARALWDEALPLPGTIAARYLAVRGLPGIESAALRYLPATPHPAGGKRLPAMLAAIRDTRTGELRAVHRTFLRPDGTGKAAVEPAKASLGPVAGCAVMLDPPRDGAPLVIGEGIESALSAAAMIGGAAWSAVSAGNLAVLPLPPLPACPVVVIAADPDAPGQRAAHAAAHRWRAEGRAVRIATPDSPDTDFNDLLRARLEARETRHG
ncbi:DUF7146 domain-containing protein [Roseicella aerolata]|uniref:Toprim domain-containing protein n=1 Tax=Roseicella aerolata TaxID=2883479 RepID=A0A9X1L8X5_9PROT|nr:toprim domain-containing protein [Roseicella aerolata]MCB4820750.1 toprim domain-containing protein [Roseicella aerolata]